MSRKRVLLVSDDTKFFEDPENSFQSRGADVFTAMTDREAVAFVEAHGADVIIVQGVPSEVSADEFGKLTSQGRSLIVVAPKGDSGGAFAGREDDGIHVVNQPVESRSLLKLSHTLLGVADRKYISILVQVRVTEPKVTTIFGKSRDLSEGGILVETNQMLTVHDQVVVSFLIPGADRMIQSDALVTREVVRAGGGRRYGLKFLSLSDSDQQIIADFVGGKHDAAAS